MGSELFPPRRRLRLPARALTLAGLLGTVVGAGCATAGAVRASPAQGGEITLDARRDILREWLAGSELGAFLEVVHIRRVAHPVYENAGLVLTLELRTKPVGEDAPHDLAYLSALNDRFQQDHGVSLWEKILYKFVHVLEIPRDSGAVSILVYHEELSVFADSTGSVATRSSVGRLVVDQVVIPTGAIRSIAGAVRPAREELSGGVPSLTSERIVEFLRVRFSPHVKVVAQTDRHVQVTVDGLRNRVISAPRVWERLELSFLLVRADGSATIVLHGDGQFAPGAGDRPPSDESFRDMEPRFTRPLREYIGALLVELKTFIIGQPKQ